MMTNTNSKASERPSYGVRLNESGCWLRADGYFNATPDRVAHAWSGTKEQADKIIAFDFAGEATALPLPVAKVETFETA